MDYADAKFILSKNKANEEGQIQYKIGRRGGIYNSCYAMALGYLQRHFKQLKVAHRVYRRVAAVHENMCNLREQAKMSATRVSFTAFVGDTGCTQPHR